jgi:hypothetical protein
MRRVDDVPGEQVFRLEKVIEVAERGLPVGEMIAALTNL